jgi:hypothetical protein
MLSIEIYLKTIKTECLVFKYPEAKCRIKTNMLSHSFIVDGSSI